MADEDRGVVISKLTEKDIGKWVTYTPSYGEVELGKIKSWNDTYIFVVYNCGGEWHRFQDFTGAATNPTDLMFGR